VPLLWSTRYRGVAPPKRSSSTSRFARSLKTALGGLIRTAFTTMLWHGDRGCLLYRLPFASPLGELGSSLDPLHLKREFPSIAEQAVRADYYCSMEMSRPILLLFVC